ncbi:MAG: SPFH domain-containing protein [Planctomycetes bacterium]|nr:SPFH domain-containing protein [Planctomycetota bacterium]
MQPAPRFGTYSQSPLQEKKEETPKPAPAWRRFLKTISEKMGDDMFVILVATGGAIVRASGVQVQSGHKGLLFHFGRASKVLDHGFRPLIPYFQTVTIVPTRSRTMDLPSQRVVNQDGLVYFADANLVYHIEDVRRAVVEVDNLEEGMMQMLTLGVQEVLRATDRYTISDTVALTKALELNLSARLAPWGVAVDKAGFPTLSPSAKSLRITQLDERVEERHARFQAFRTVGLSTPTSLALTGTRHFPRSKTRALQRLALKRAALRKQISLRRLAIQKAEREL